MKNKLSLYTTVTLLAAASQAGAQGYLNIGADADRDFERKMPFSWTVGAQLGYDSNVGVTSSNEQESTYISGQIGVSYASGDRRTALNYSATYSPLYYFDAPNGVDDFQNNWRVGFDFRRRINPKLVITDSFYLAYEVEPDYQIGATVARRQDPYFYGYNSLAAAYSWNRRFSTVTALTISGVDYDGPGADYFTYMFSNDFRYAFSRTTTGVVTYRFSTTDSDAPGGDYDSHYVLIGADHQFSPQLSGSIRVGAEIRESDTTPYMESSLVYRASRKTDLRWYTTYGYPTDGSSGFSNFDANLRTGLTASHRFNTRWSGNLGAHYISEDSGSIDQDTIALSAGFNYNLNKNVSLNGGYNFTTATSDNPFAEFDRSMFQLGVASRF